MTAVPDWLSPDTTRFLAGLRANNDRAWFTAHKADYEACLRRPGERFAEALAAALAARTGQPHEFRVFRIHRDVRFARDKTPYNAHLHISLSADGGCSEGGPAWMFGLDPDRLTLGVGTFLFDAGRLAAWRNRCAGNEGETIAALLCALERGGARISEPELKRVPAPYTADHNAAALLRRKGLTVWIDQLGSEIAYGPDGPGRCAERLLTLRPVVDLLAD